jgi:hypothetical protein
MSGTDIEKPIRQQPAQLEHIAPAVDDFAFLAGIDAILRQFSGNRHDAPTWPLANSPAIQPWMS